MSLDCTYIFRIGPHFMVGWLDAYITVKKKKRKRKEKDWCDRNDNRIFLNRIRPLILAGNFFSHSKFQSDKRDTYVVGLSEARNKSFPYVKKTFQGRIL